MSVVQVGQKFSFGVTQPDNLSSFVAAKIFDNSGSSPVLLATIPMENYFGNSYQGSYEVDEPTTLLIQKSVYTDGTYTEFDPNYSQADETQQVIQSSGGGLDQVLALIYQIMIASGVDVQVSNNSINVEIECPGGS